MRQNKWKRYVVIIIFVILILLTCLFFFSGFYLQSNFANVSFEQILFNLAQPLGNADKKIVMKGIFWCVVLPIISTVLLFWDLYKTVFTTQNNKKILISTIIVVLCFSLSSFYLFKASKIGPYLTAQQGSGTIYQDYYVDPKTVHFSFPEQKRNLIYIYIYMESMEQTYDDMNNGGAFEKSLIPNLSQLKKEGVNFGAGSSFMASGAMGWTMGSLVAQTAGINIKSFRAQDDFDPNATVIPGAYALGNILKDNGYTNMFLLGSDANYSSRSTYFKSHGDYDIKDVYWAKNCGLISQEYWENWGFEDKKLFDYVKSILSDLKNEQPFNLTILTADTHFYDGYLCPDCEQTEDSQYSNVIRCSDKRVYSFVKWCETQEWYPNTTIILVGDHLTMDDEWSKRIDSDFKRSIYYTILNSATTPQRSDSREFIALDMFPTTLSALGVQYDSERLGLGTDLFKTEDSLVEKYGLEELDTMLYSPSNYYIDNFLK